LFASLFSALGSSENVLRNFQSKGGFVG
jgi:hypothetical protein